MLNDLRFRLRAIFRRNIVESELDEELRFHFENEIEKYKHAGMKDEEAVRRARMVFGGQDQVKEDCREARGTSFMETSTQDIRYALRTLSKNPGFSLIAMLTLALGVGASTAVFSLVNTILLKPLPYPNANRLAMVWRERPIASYYGSDQLPWMPQEYQLAAGTSTDFQSMGAFKKESFNLTGANTPELLEGVRASAGFFPALGVQAQIGRTFTTQEDQQGHEHVVVLSDRVWKKRFGGDPHVVGRTIDLNGYPYAVIGVMPASFAFPNGDGMPASLDLPRETQLWVPMALAPAARGANEIGVIAELKPGVRMAHAQQVMSAVDKAIEEKIPATKGWSSLVVPLTQQTVIDTRRPLLLLLGAVGMVLLIACSNVAGLTLNRSLGRRREFTLRSALGAKRGRLIRQLMTESLMLAAGGGLTGILLSEAALYAVKRFGPASIPHLHDAGLDLRVLAFALGITVVTGILFGLAPAAGATRMNLVEALKEGGQRSGVGAAAPRMRNALLISQIALAMVLVVAAGLLVRTFFHMLRSERGFDATHVVTFELPLPSPRYADTNRMAQVYQQVLERLQSTAGVQSAGFASVVPMGGIPDGTVIRIPGHLSAPNAEFPYANYSFISPGYFRAIGAALQRGRDFADADTLAGVPVTIINSAMAKKFWPGEDPIGKQVGVGLKRIPVRTIVGVVADVKQTSLRDEPVPQMFVPYTQNEIKVWPSMQTMQYAVRTQSDPSAMAGSVRKAVNSVDPDLPIANFATMNTLVDASLTADRFSMLLIGAFGALALLLAAIGMYGVISYSVMQRTAEIGVRIALGARREQIFAMVLGQGGRLASAGIGIGLIAALATTRVMARFLYGVQPTDPGTFVFVSLLLAAIALLACYVPARMAMKVDPLAALRYE